MSNSDATEPETLPTGGRPSSPARPWWLGIAVIATGAVWLYGAASLPQTAQYAQIGPGLFVTVIGLALIALGALLLLQIARGEEFRPQDSEDASADAPADYLALGTAIVAAGLPLVTIRHLGFPLTAALSFAVLARAFGSRRPLVDLAIGMVIGILAYFGFILLGVSLGGFLPLLGL